MQRHGLRACQRQRQLSVLNEPQQRAVDHQHGALLVAAGPGSGKTRVVTERTAKLIEAGVSPRAILLCTFTNKAAGEMRGRLSKRVGKVSAQIAITTMHSLAARMLRGVDPNYLEGRTRRFSIYSNDDQRAVVRDIVATMKLKAGDFPPGKLVSWISRQKSAGAHAEDEQLEETLDQAQLIWRHYEAELRAANAFDFDDLIGRFMALAESSTALGAELRRRFEYVIVDEYQDTNQPQYRLVKALASSGNLCVVGDVQQSVYGFRGADRAIIERFKDEFGATDVFLYV